MTFIVLASLWFAVELAAGRMRRPSWHVLTFIKTHFLKPGPVGQAISALGTAAGKQTAQSLAGPWPAQSETLRAVKKSSVRPCAVLAVVHASVGQSTLQDRDAARAPRFTVLQGVWVCHRSVSV